VNLTRKLIDAHLVTGKAVAGEEILKLIDCPTLTLNGSAKP